MKFNHIILGETYEVIRKDIYESEEKTSYSIRLKVDIATTGIISDISLEEFENIKIGDKIKLKLLKEKD